MKRSLIAALCAAALLTLPALAAPTALSPKGDKGAPNAQVTALEARTAALEARIAQLEAAANRPPAPPPAAGPAAAGTGTAAEPVSPPPPAPTILPSRIRAPFEVVGSNGQVILRVSEKHMDKGAHVVISPGSANNYLMRFHNGSGAVIAALGEGNKGGGMLLAQDAEGHTAASIIGADHAYYLWNGTDLIAAMKTDSRNVGLVAVYNGSEPVAFLTRSSGLDGGNVTTRLNNGEGVFSAGASRNGAGEACVARRTQAGDRRAACVGQGLPAIGAGR